MTGPVQPWIEKIGVGTTVADSMVSADDPIFVMLTTLVAAEFGWTIPKSIIAGESDKVFFPVGVVVALG
jgi:hypothetical protein